MEEGGFTIVAKGSKRCAHGNRGMYGHGRRCVVFRFFMATGPVFSDLSVGLFAPTTLTPPRQRSAV
jgi:hypothetical protein